MNKKLLKLQKEQEKLVRESKTRKLIAFEKATLKANAVML